MAPKATPAAKQPDLATIVAAVVAALSESEAATPSAEPMKVEVAKAELAAKRQAATVEAPQCQWVSGETRCEEPVSFRRDGTPKRFCAEHVKTAREAWKARVESSAEVTAARRAENEVIIASVLDVVEKVADGPRPKAQKLRFEPGSTSFGLFLVKEGYAVRDGFAVEMTVQSLPKAKAFVKAWDDVEFENSTKPRLEVTK